jgi:hypothetical protein
MDHSFLLFVSAIVAAVPKSPRLPATYSVLGADLKRIKPTANQDPDSLPGFNPHIPLC